MSYLVLARKYRPKAFAEVAGQELVTRVLAGAIEEHRVGHAYLFSGPRGTGKTTSARLFAKALNCDTGPTPTPCGTCERCVSADAGSEIDIVEIDAASNTGVEHVRDLRDQAAYTPMRARFKVYIIDEVHMLSRAAFNALLKTLEEPPPHVKFLFATTEPHKVPDTVLSRCQVLRLSPIPEETIAAKLTEIFGLEGVTAEPGVADELARRARGGMRDALSMADQLLALVGSNPTREDVERLSTEGSSVTIDALLDALVAADPKATLEALPAVEGGESTFLTGLLDHLRGCLLAALVGAEAPMLAGGPEARERLVARGRTIGAKRLQLWLEELLAARERMRVIPAHARTVLEVTLLDLCRPEATLELSEIVERLHALEARLASGASGAILAGPGSPPAAAQPATRPAPAPDRTPPVSERRTLRPTPPPERAAAARVSSDPGDRGGSGDPGDSNHSGAPAAPARRGPLDTPRVRTNSSADAWKGFLEELALGSPSLAGLLTRKAKLVQYGGGRAVVRTERLTDEERPLVEDKRNQKLCSKAFTKAVGRDLQAIFEDADQKAPGQDDAFTSEVADLFEGRVDE